MPPRREYVYGVHDPTHAIGGGVFQTWPKAQEHMAAIKNQGGRGALVKKFLHKADAAYFAEWARPPPVATKLSADPSTTIVVHTDGSCRMSLQGEVCAGIGVYFGPNHPCNAGEPFDVGPRTNNRAELTAIRRALEIIADPANAEHFASRPRVAIYTDSSYSRDALGQWRTAWEASNFRDGTILNRDVIEPIWALMDSYEKDISINWVKGHAGNARNEGADRLANAGADVQQRSSNNLEKKRKRESS